MTTAPAAASTEADIVRRPIPLRDRRHDWFFIVVFTVFIGSSFTGDIVNMVCRPDPDADFFLARVVYHVYADGTDLQLRVRLHVHHRAQGARLQRDFGALSVVSDD